MEEPPKQLQKTLALIKPDAVASGRASEIMQIIELSGFTIIAKEHLQVRHGGGRRRRVAPAPQLLRMRAAQPPSRLRSLPRPRS